MIDLGLCPHGVRRTGEPLILGFGSTEQSHLVSADAPSGVRASDVAGNHLSGEVI